MPNLTEKQRVQSIKDLLDEQAKMPPAQRYEVLALPVPGGEELCQVIRISVDAVVLNPHSHRVRAQLDDDPAWEAHKASPFSEEAQELIARHVRAARKEADFAALRDNLDKEGQTDAGAITDEGVLINANTRVVALRELADEDKRYVKVAVLPHRLQAHELALLELRLQMRQDFKEDYSFTNELLFIQELANERHMEPAQIAKELRIDKGANEVLSRLRMLALIRQLQNMPAEPLRLTFFDDHKVKREHLRDLDGAYSAVVDTDPAEATRILEAFLLSVAVDVTPVHQLRKIDPDFMSDYMLPHLEDDEGLVATQTTLLATTPTGPAPARPAGVDALLTDDSADEPASVNVRGLINVVTQRDHKVTVHGTNGQPIVLEQDEVKDALKAAIVAGVTEKNRDDRTSNKLEAPLQLLKEATQRIDKCREACTHVVDSDEFGDSRRKSLEAKFKALRKAYQLLEADLTKAEVIRK